MNGFGKDINRKSIAVLQKGNIMKDDVIYRQAAINAANRTDYRGLSVEDVTKVTDEVVKELKKLPSAQTEHEYMMEEFMFGQDMGNPEDGSL